MKHRHIGNTVSSDTETISLVSSVVMKSVVVRGCTGEGGGVAYVGHHPQHETEDINKDSLDQTLMWVYY